VNIKIVGMGHYLELCDQLHASAALSLYHFTPVKNGLGDSVNSRAGLDAIEK
jgi:hypothetical protein